ncbi:ATP-binding cassette domain-containing protein [Rossellomorea marisflavi]|nr:ABC transporter ATP-binding protein [Rossellomorea marisflavi]QHA38596.1 ATP-binding cassette domain-containing protein [Rossellomorea marisflavi]USK94518.1 ABC transporter ATP-binding protein [Rossellomorea marisflavi]
MMLTMERVSITSRGKKIVDDVSLLVKQGEWLALVGESGSGKSLLSQAIGRMLPRGMEVSGRLMLGDCDLGSLSKSEMRSMLGRDIAYISQDYHGSFTPFLTIGEHFKEYGKAHGVSREECKRKMGEALESVGLASGMESRYPSELSGGQLQRIAIALALFLSPCLVIADEITTALDSVTGHRVLQLLASRQKETGCGILFITHDWRTVRRYADRIAVMKEGVIVETGGKHRILDHPHHHYTKRLIESAPVLGRGLRSGVEGGETV